MRLPKNWVKVFGLLALGLSLQSSMALAQQPRGFNADQLISLYVADNQMLRGTTRAQVEAVLTAYGDPSTFDENGKPRMDGPLFSSTTILVVKPGQTAAAEAALSHIKGIQASRTTSDLLPVPAHAPKYSLAQLTAKKSVPASTASEKAEVLNSIRALQNEPEFRALKGQAKRYLLANLYNAVLLPVNAIILLEGQIENSVRMELVKTVPDFNGDEFAQKLESALDANPSLKEQRQIFRKTMADAIQITRQLRAENAELLLATFGARSSVLAGLASEPDSELAVKQLRRYAKTVKAGILEQVRMGQVQLNYEQQKNAAELAAPGSSAKLENPKMWGSGSHSGEFSDTSFNSTISRDFISEQLFGSDRSQSLAILDFALKPQKNRELQSAATQILIDLVLSTELPIAQLTSAISAAQIEATAIMNVNDYKAAGFLVNRDVNVVLERERVTQKRNSMREKYGNLRVVAQLLNFVNSQATGWSVGSTQSRAASALLAFKILNVLKAESNSPSVIARLQEGVGSLKQDHIKEGFEKLVKAEPRLKALSEAFMSESEFATATARAEAALAKAQATGPTTTPSATVRTCKAVFAN